MHNINGIITPMTLSITRIRIWCVKNQGENEAQGDFTKGSDESKSREGIYLSSKYLFVFHLAKFSPNNHQSICKVTVSNHSRNRRIQNLQNLSKFDLLAHSLAWVYLLEVFIPSRQNLFFNLNCHSNSH